MKTKILAMFALLFLIASGSPSHGQAVTETDTAKKAAIRQTALDSIEGCYEGDANRMERALHPELAKRMVSTDPKTGRSTLSQMGAMTLVQNTKKGGGTRFRPEQQLKEVTIRDIYRNAACVKIDAATWVDYLQMAKWNGEWKIVNVLWEPKPDPSVK